MAVTRIHSRDQLKDYALRALGAPVLQVNVDDNQLEDRIDDALDMFWEYHADGSVRTFLKHSLTVDDFANGYLSMPDGILSVIRILAVDNQKALINLQYQMFITDIMNIRQITTGGINGYVLTNSYLNMINDFFSFEKVIKFNKHRDQLRIDGDWSTYNVGDVMLIECYVVQDPEEFGETYNNYWLKQYVTALFKKQWGANLMKFSGVNLPGNIQVNGKEIYQDALDEVKDLEERLRHEFQEPVDFMIG
jgi:hypothetical protein